MMAARKPYDQLAVGRALSARQQSPHIGSVDQRAAQLTELNKAFDKPRGADPEDRVAYLALLAQKGEEVHHQNILETIAPAYKGLNEADAEELTGILRGRGYGMGNELLNVINLPMEAHKDLHKLTKALGAEVDMNRGKYVGAMAPELRDMIDAGDVPSVRYRADMATRYLDKFNPILRDAQDEVLNQYYKGEGDGAGYLMQFLADRGVTPLTTDPLQ